MMEKAIRRKRARPRLVASTAVTGLCCALGSVLLSSVSMSTFVPAPLKATSETENLLHQKKRAAIARLGVVSGLVAGGIEAAKADLPPLEELPLQGLSGSWVTHLDDPVETFEMGIMNLPQMIIGLPFCVWPPICAACWAFTWVTNTKPFDSKLTTYIGAGTLPPEGYTNPLDVRMGGKGDDDDDEDDIFDSPSKVIDGSRGQKRAKSSIV
eukprot:TRINITY_DN33022_c0_g1_i1.p1 TRINITY_DN33022_c0_g1~~TRINITY_DN33022_c0_g1_i1.p1  ORF type:complete len:211 (-),score=32.48 TRINITY_DN33022_c0_g1_i1:108-740(-)